MKTFQLVTSTYNDIHKFDWKHLVPDYFDFLIYRKCDDLEIGETRVNDDFIDIPNYGSCDYSFFHHIVNNYDNLSDITIFTKMNLTEDHFDNFVEVFRNAKDYDFYQGGSSAISHVWYNDSNKYLIDLPTKYTKVIQNLSLTKDKKLIGSELYNHAGHADQQVDWFVYLFGDKVAPGEICTYQYGPCFSVSKEIILRHPKSVYKHFLEIFHPCNSWDFEVAKKVYNTSDLKKQAWAVGRSYHDELLRFYRVFFTYGIDKQRYKINEI